MVYLPTEAAKYEDFAKLSPYYQLAMANSRELMGFLKQQSGIDIPNGMEFDPLWVLAPIAKPGGKDEVYSVETKQIVQKNKDGTETEKTVFQYYSATSNPEHGNYVKNDSGEFLKISRPLTDAEKEDPYNEGRAELQAYIHFSQYYGPNEVARMYFSILQMVLAITLQIFMTAQSQMEDYLEEAEEINQKISLLQAYYNKLNTQRINSTGYGDETVYVAVTKQLINDLKNTLGLTLPDRDAVVGVDKTRIAPYFAQVQRMWAYTNKDDWFDVYGINIGWDHHIKANNGQTEAIRLSRYQGKSHNTTMSQTDFENRSQEIINDDSLPDGYDNWSQSKKDEYENELFNQRTNFSTLLTLKSLGDSENALLEFLSQDPVSIKFHFVADGDNRLSHNQATYVKNMALQDGTYVVTGDVLASGKGGMDGLSYIKTLDLYVRFDPKSLMVTKKLSEIADDTSFDKNTSFYVPGEDIDVLLDAIRSKIDSWNIRIQVPTNAISSMSSEVSQIFQTGTELISRVGERWKQVAQSLR